MSHDATLVIGLHKDPEAAAGSGEYSQLLIKFLPNLSVKWQATMQIYAEKNINFS